MNSIDIDVGGTFTDLVLNFGGKTLIKKSPTTPYDLSVCFSKVIEEGASALGLKMEELLPSVDMIRYSTTIAMNRLIERKGPRLGLITTEGHEDVVLIGRGAQWIDGTRVQDDPSKGSKAGGLQSLSFIGPLGIALLVLAGATLDLALAPRRSAFRRVWRAILTPRQPHVASRRVTARAAAAADGRPNRRPPTLTDPAIDLKASLTELMGVLQQAGIGCDAPRSFAPVAAAMYRDQAYRRPPRRMEALQRYSSSGRSGVASRHV